VVGTDTYFFTNREGVTTLDCFRTILSNNTDRFDVIVGHFFVTGFYSIWESLEDVSLDKVKPDRRKLDKIVISEILGLTDNEQLEVYCAVAKLVKNGLVKARSV
jgi:hypothetical protein